MCVSHSPIHLPLNVPISFLFTGSMKDKSFQDLARAVGLQLREHSLCKTAGRQHGWGCTSSRPMGSPDWQLKWPRSAWSDWHGIGGGKWALVWAGEGAGITAGQHLSSQNAGALLASGWVGKDEALRRQSPSWGWGWRGGIAKKGQFHQAGMSGSWGGAGWGATRMAHYSQGEGSKQEMRVQVAHSSPERWFEYVQKVRTRTQCGKSEVWAAGKGMQCMKAELSCLAGWQQWKHSSTDFSGSCSGLRESWKVPWAENLHCSTRLDSSWYLSKWD